jgi:hypothetical protein
LAVPSYDQINIVCQYRRLPSPPSGIRATGASTAAVRGLPPRGDRGPADLASPVTSHVRCRTARVSSTLGLGVAIARAMYFKSKVLILDESTNHLSVKETTKVFGFVKGLAAQNVTGIFVSHNLHHGFVSYGDTQKQVSQFPVRHCERSEAIQGPQYDRLDCCRPACCGPWIASSQGLLAMTAGSPLTRSLR